MIRIKLEMMHQRVINLTISICVFFMIVGCSEARLYQNDYGFVKFNTLSNLTEISIENEYESVITQTIVNHLIYRQEDFSINLLSDSRGNKFIECWISKYTTKYKLHGNRTLDPMKLKKAALLGLDPNFSDLNQVGGVSEISQCGQEFIAFNGNFYHNKLKLYCDIGFIEGEVNGKFIILRYFHYSRTKKIDDFQSEFRKIRTTFEIYCDSPSLNYNSLVKKERHWFKFLTPIGVWDTSNPNVIGSATPPSLGHSKTRR